MSVSITLACLGLNTEFTRVVPEPGCWGAVCVGLQGPAVALSPSQKGTPRVFLDR